jgi:hypothetical protein
MGVQRSALAKDSEALKGGIAAEAKVHLRHEATTAPFSQC